MVWSTQLVRNAVIPTVFLVTMAIVLLVLLAITLMVVNVLHAKLELIHLLNPTHAHLVVPDVLLAVEFLPVLLAQPITICHQGNAPLVEKVCTHLLDQNQMSVPLVMM